MFGLDLPFWGALAAGAIWWAVRRFRPDWAARLDKVEELAAPIFDAVEVLGRKTGLSGAQKLAEYMERLERKARRYGIPLTQRERDHAAELAAEWALAMKAIPLQLQQLADAGDRIVEKLKEMPHGPKP